MNEQQSTNTTVLNDAVPEARYEDLVITESGDEVLVYDKQRHQIHHLNQTSAVIWRLCDGRRSAADIAQAAGTKLGVAGSDLENVAHALAKLDEAHLLQGPMAPQIRPNTQTRRKLMKRMAIAGAGVAVVASITAPSASAATSCSGGVSACNSNTDGQCCCLTGGNIKNCASASIGVCTLGVCVSFTAG